MRSGVKPWLASMCRVLKQNINYHNAFDQPGVWNSTGELNSGGGGNPVYN